MKTTTILFLLMLGLGTTRAQTSSQQKSVLQHGRPTLNLQSTNFPAALRNVTNRLARFGLPGNGKQTLPKPNKENLTAVERGPGHTVWQYEITAETNSNPNVLKQKQGKAEKHSFVELASGLNYKQNGKWIPANPEIVIQRNGWGVGTKAQHGVRLAPNINTPGSVEVTTPTGKRLRSNLVGISFYDWKNDRSVHIAEIKDRIGTLAGKTEVIYPDAFQGIKADVGYTFQKAGMSQDVIFREQLPSPADWQLDPETTQVEIWTEWLNPPKTKTRDRRDKTTGQQVASTIDFGDIRIRSTITR